jgi:integrase
MPIAFAIATGLRRGELLGLRWSDIDFDHGTVRVNWELQRHKGKGLVFVEPKTVRARRQLQLPGGLLTMLRESRRQQSERRLILGLAWKDHDVLFDAGDGRPIDPDFFSEACKRTFGAAGLPPKVRLHDLRHAFGTLLFLAVHPKIASAALGHASEGLHHVRVPAHGAGPGRAGGECDLRCPANLGDKLGTDPAGAANTQGDA